MDSSKVYFLCGATVALIVRDPVQFGSPGLAVGLIGHEGAACLQKALGLGSGVLSQQVQTSGSAWAMDGKALAKATRNDVHMLLTFGRYLWRVSQEVANMAAFSQRQEVHQRLAAWIVLSAVRSGTVELNLTHAHLADMLGVRRASITDAALFLKDLALIDYQRGQIQILSLEGLKAATQ
ncbi:helix-turn-helix domain-containing protein [Curvibacter sp. APW13]|uniref:Crp/Fnr family transcriptional regulator n=1 Tax=Curvibacter sp. APW13 TaxID=3077236 RepID=UPI0028DF5B35|nr:helix-turn-helix domain-containing protein [Curvibacter sp. APW13]MDT8992600.1 helix-turn-helix domain-containing protein [Curvibacter sp. APW13]